jgi:hypothetical protein
MTTELAKRPGTVMRTYTQQVRDHTSAMARAQDQYFAALKRAEAQYFETVKVSGCVPSHSRDASVSAIQGRRDLTRPRRGVIPVLTSPGDPRRRGRTRTERGPG